MYVVYVEEGRCLFDHREGTNFSGCIWLMLRRVCVCVITGRELISVDVCGLCWEGLCSFHHREFVWEFQSGRSEDEVISDVAVHISGNLNKITWNTHSLPGIMREQRTPSLVFVHNSVSIEFFHNSHLIRWIEQKRIYKRIWDVTRNWTQINCLAVRHFNHYTRMFSVLLRPIIECYSCVGDFFQIV